MFGDVVFFFFCIDVVLLIFFWVYVVFIEYLFVRFFVYVLISCSVIRFGVAFIKLEDVIIFVKFIVWWLIVICVMVIGVIVELVVCCLCVNV